MDSLRSSAWAERGASAVEYSLVVVAIAAMIVLVVFVLGQRTLGLFQTTSGCIAAEAEANC